MKKMFCFQCEQTAGGSGCVSKDGICGKTAEIASLQDELTGALIGLAYVAKDNKDVANEQTNHLLFKGLFATLTNVDFYDFSLQHLISDVRKEKCRLVIESGHARHVNRKKYEVDMNELWHCDPDTRSLKSLILFGSRGVASYAYHADTLGYHNEMIPDYLYQALTAVGYETDPDRLLSTVLDIGLINLHCMELLEKAHTETYGIPTPQKVSHTIEKGPFIIVSGHDLHDLELILKQTDGKGINVYSHGEMLPAHGYPGLNKYPHFKGHFGTGWQNQKYEFNNLPGAILFTSNCLMPPAPSYKDRVFTTGPVYYPGVMHINDAKDFSPVINRAWELGGFDQPLHMTGINGGANMTTGYSYRILLTLKDRLADSIRSGKIKHIYLVGGCDGARSGRNYYTDFVRQCPDDSIILTLACGKYRFNDLDLGEIDGIPRLIDMGQCNDAYGAIMLATELANEFNCSINELPLTIVLSWYEQKAVAVLLTLLHLGFKGILLGPSMPAFISPNIFRVIARKYDLKPTTTPEEDLETLK